MQHAVDRAEAARAAGPRDLNRALSLGNIMSCLLGSK
jgi:hypothetical protein